MSVRALSLRASVVHGFVTEPWYSRHVLVSCERVRSSTLRTVSRLSVLVPCWSVVFGSRRSCLEFRCRVGVRTLVSLCERALSRLCVLFRVGAWCSDPGAHVLSFGFVLGFRHSSLCVSVRSLVRSTWTRVGVSIGCVYSCYILCCVARSLCIHWLSAFMLSCLVWTCGVCFLISCVFVSCSAHGWWFVCVFVLCEQWLLCHVLSCQFVLTPPILLPDYWLICPSCSPSLPSSFAPFIISLCLQFGVGSLPYVGSSYISCPALSCVPVVFAYYC